MVLPDNKKTEVVVLYCGRSFAGEEYIAEGSRDCGDYTTRLVRVPCSSEVRTEFIIKLLDEGADGVLLVACPESKCRFLIGSQRASSRVAYARKLVAETGLNADRVQLKYKQGLTMDGLMALAGDMAQQIMKMDDAAAAPAVGES